MKLIKFNTFWLGFAMASKQPMPKRYFTETTKLSTVHKYVAIEKRCYDDNTTILWVFLWCFLVAGARIK